MSTTKQDTAVPNTEAVELWGSVIKAVGITNRKLQTALRERFGLNEAEVDTMITLGGKSDGRASLTELARSAAFTSGGYTKVADRLCMRGVVQRTFDASDRRVTFLELTEDGAEMASELRELVAEINREQFIAVLGTEDARLVAEAMDRLRAANE